MKKRHYFVPCQAALFKIIEKIVLIAIAVVIICASAFQLRTTSTTGIAVMSYQHQTAYSNASWSGTASDRMTFTTTEHRATAGSNYPAEGLYGGANATPQEITSFSADTSATLNSNSNYGITLSNTSQMWLYPPVRLEQFSRPAYNEQTPNMTALRPVLLPTPAERMRYANDDMQRMYGFCPTAYPAHSGNNFQRPGIVRPPWNVAQMGKNESITYMPMVPPPPMLPLAVPQAAQSSSPLASVAGQPRNWTVMQLAPVGDHVQFSATHLQQMVRMGVPICDSSSTSVILDGALQMEATQKKKLPEWLREGLVKITQMKETEPSPVPPPSEKSAFKDDDENNRHSLPKCNFSVGLISSEDESELENDESALQMQEVTRILLSVTHEKTVSICTKVLKEEKTIPKLLMQSQALSLLQNLGDDDEDDDETAKKEKYAKSTDKTNRKKWKRMSKNSEKVKNNCDADMLPQNELHEKSQDRRDAAKEEKIWNDGRINRIDQKKYRKFINGFVIISALFYRLLEKRAEWEWFKACQSAFDALMYHHTSAPIPSICSARWR
ncbi:hypothetical protein T12_14518 [Trichinella patagoniensis]|uniref:Uncharacterized protein n=1 Tax=Trichinella patagoniensis TaxID=990121 RepID=A0A0V0ZKG3_9BILA|nr:hypothetical protein T12_14518 [Trichinella patagoniensis]